MQQFKDAKKTKNKKGKEIIIIGASNSNFHIRSKRTTTKTRRHKWEEKQLYGYFKRQTGQIAHKMTLTWPKKGNLKREIKSLLIK